MTFSLNRCQRLRTQHQYDQVFKQRQRVINKHLIVYYCNNGLSHPRLGIIVSKRNCAKAVGRNRIKRQWRECFRLQQHQLPAIDCVLIAKRGIPLASREELQLCLKQLFKRLIKRYLAS